MKKIVKEYHVPILCFLSLLLLGGLLIRRPFDLNDYYWHSKTGEYIFSTKSVPQTGIFSWVALERNLPWIAHEWLFGLFIFAVGEVNLPVFLVLVYISLVFLPLIFVEKPWTKNVLAVFMLATAIFFSANLILTARPHVFMFLFLSFSVGCVHKARNTRNPKWLFGIPLVMPFWANLHGGSSNMGYLILFLYLISGIVPFQWGGLYGEKRTRKELLVAGIALVLSVGFIILNPNGLQLMLYPYQNMADSSMLQYIAEWGSADIKRPLDLFLIFVPVFFTALIWISKKRVSLYELLLFGLAAFMALRSARFVYFLTMVTFFVTVEKLPECSIKKSAKWLASFSFISLFLFLVVANAVYPGTLHFVDHDIEGIESIRDVDAKRLFTDYNLGGRLIHEDILVSIDGRADVYKDQGFVEHMRFVRGDMSLLEAEDYLNRENYDYAVMGTKTRPFSYFEVLPGWEEIETTKDIRLFKKIG